MHATFGPGVSIAPTKQTADGGASTPISQMSDAERQQAKVRVAAYTITLMKMPGVGAASALRGGQASPSREPSAATGPDAGDAEDAGADDAGSDPWAGQESLAQVQAKERRQETEAEHRKKVAVPNPTDTVDPWAGQESLAQRRAQQAAEQTARQAAQTSEKQGEPGHADRQPSLDASASPPSSMVPDFSQGVANPARDEQNGVQLHSSPSQPEDSNTPFIRDEDGEEYSLSDRSLGQRLTIEQIAHALNAVDVKDLTKEGK